MFKINLKKNIKPVLIILIIFIGMKIVFSKETILNLLKIEITLSYLFILPGFLLLQVFWKEQFTQLEKLIIGSILGISIVGIASYYLGLFVIHVKYHYIIIPLTLYFIAIVGILYNRLKKQKP